MLLPDIRQAFIDAMLNVDDCTIDVLKRRLRTMADAQLMAGGSPPKPVDLVSPVGSVRLWGLSTYTINAVLSTHGLIDERPPDRDRPTWDGRSLLIQRLPNEEHVLHEVAHWLIAWPWYRPLPNYGLGPDPDGGPSADVCTVGQEEADTQEALAAILTVSLMRHAGLDWETAFHQRLGRWGYGPDSILFWGHYLRLLRLRSIDLQDPIGIPTP
jgi:hypothetical protein